MHKKIGKSCEQFPIEQVFEPNWLNTIDYKNKENQRIVGYNSIVPNNLKIETNYATSLVVMV
jgi:hypothetical protein